MSQPGPSPQPSRSGRRPARGAHAQTRSNRARWLLAGGLVVVVAVAAALVMALLPASARSSGAARTDRTGGTARTAPPSRVLIVGDSMAASLGNGIYTTTHFFFGWLEMPGVGLSNLGKYFGLSIDNRGTTNCGLTGGTFTVKNTAPITPSGPCQISNWQAGWPTYYRQAVQQDRPAVSIYLGRLETVNHQIDGQTTHIGDPSYDAYVMYELRLAVSILTSGGGKVILMTSPYYSTGTDAHGQPWPEDNPARVDLYNSMLRQVAAENPKRVYLFDLNRLLDPGGRFASQIDGFTVRYNDGVHITPSGDCLIAPEVLPYIVEALKSKSAPPQPVSAADAESAMARIPATVCPPAGASAGTSPAGTS